MSEKIILKNRLIETRREEKLSQTALAKSVGFSRTMVNSIETGRFSPTAKLT